MNPASARRFAAVLLAAPIIALACSGCTNAMLSKYRDPQLLETHRYRLGEQYIDVDGIRMRHQETAGPGRTW